MEILPRDLGVWHNVALIRLRALSGQAGAAPTMGALPSSDPTAPQKRLGLLGRFWTRGLDLPPEAKTAVLDGMGGMIGGFLGGIGGAFGGGFGLPALGAAASGHEIAGAVFGTLALTAIGFGFAGPGISLKAFHNRPVSITDIDRLLALTQGDDIQAAYLQLVRDALQKTGLSPAAGQSLRDALRTLGDALDRLPSAPLPGSDVEDVRENLERVRAEAVAESDPVVAESLERRIGTLEHALRSADRSALLARRANALREEMRAQIQAARVGLAAQRDGAGDVGSFASIAESVRRVAGEANAVADARAELDAPTALTAPPRRDAAAQTGEPTTTVLRAGQQR
jgi:hypothetical protein